MSVAESLVVEALEGKRWSSRGCFTSNDASADLSKLGQEALDAIESVASERETLFLNSLSEPHPNVATVMVTYVRIAKELLAYGRLLDFLNRLPSLLRVELLGGIFIMWCCNRGAEGIPDELRPALEQRRATSPQIEMDTLCRILDYDPRQNV